MGQRFKHIHVYMQTYRKKKSLEKNIRKIMSKYWSQESLPIYDPIPRKHIAKLINFLIKKI